MTANKKVRTRIAPSPTGFPHIGTLYQALFNYAWAKRNNGHFIVRIEDTDQSRLVKGAEESIYAAFDWLGLTEDESPRKGGDHTPYKQSDRLEYYQKYAQELVENDHAYYCFCTKARLDKLRKQQQQDGVPPMYDGRCSLLKAVDIEKKLKGKKQHVIRMKVPHGQTLTVDDPVRGKIVFDTNLIDDQVILKSDGFPTYHLALVVDDHLMKITDALRGEEWIPSWPKHVYLYQFLGWDAPQFHHTPILRNPDKSKMSKRHSHTSVTWYQEEGFLPEALRNFLALMGWSHPDEKEIFNLDEFVKYFDPKDMKAVGPIFDLSKLEWLNGEYIRMMDEDDLAAQIHEFSKTYFENRYPEDIIRYVVPLVQTRIKTLKEFDTYARFFVEAPTKYEKDISSNTDTWAKITEALEGIDKKDWHADIIGEHLQAVAQEIGMGIGKFFMLIRVALTGKKVTPPTNESMEILGKDECITRLSRI